MLHNGMQILITITHRNPLAILTINLKLYVDLRPQFLKNLQNQIILHHLMHNQRPQRHQNGIFLQKHLCKKRQQKLRKKEVL